jgi:cytochrome c oxidase assembly protein subunit 15
MVFGMVLLGGAVRLTGSGLSMVDWQPLIGIIPPFGQAQWLAVFEQYKQFPEFQQVNASMELADFRFIYLMEYAHRILGRLIGLVFLLPFLWFLWGRRIQPALVTRLWLLFGLGAIQGGIGWYMVKSGLVDNPAVSQYRLTLHLVTAVLIYAYMVRVVVGLVKSGSSRVDTDIPRGVGIFVLTTILLMICSGGFVAGTHAGFIYNTFPTMGGDWIPDQVFALNPWWKNLFENPVAIQFVHRILALIVTALVLGYSFYLFRNSDRGSRAIALTMATAVILQVSLGITTLLLEVPVGLGVAHQGGALLLLTVVTVAVCRSFPKLHTPGAAA